MEDEQERLRLAQDESDDVEGHGLEPSEGEQERLRLAQDEDEEDVEGHRL